MFILTNGCLSKSYLTAHFLQDIAASCIHLKNYFISAIKRVRSMTSTIGLDVGGTKIDAVQIDPSGKILEHIHIPTNTGDGYKGVENQIIEIVQGFQKKSKNPPIGVGIGIAGQIDQERGFVHFAPNLHWHDIPLVQDLSKTLKIPITVTNDVRAATWGEWHHGAGKGCSDFVCVFLGTGIGSGIVSGGNLLYGSSYSAGELGHMIVKINGPRCTCGSKGCFEAIAGGWAIAKRAKRALKQSDITAKEVISLAHSGNPVAEKIIEEALNTVVAGAINIVNIFNPHLLILGGGLMKGLPEIPLKVQKGIEQFALKSASREVKVVPAALQDVAGSIGAATLAFHLYGN
jgi:glucokinase